MLSKRRTNAVGSPMLVKLPVTGGYKDSGEGGLAFFLVVFEDTKESRNVCLSGSLVWPVQDVCLSVTPNNNKHESYIDAGLLIGSTGQSLWSDKLERYFEPEFKDLTAKGQDLFLRLEEIYGKRSIKIITLLDT